VKKQNKRIALIDDDSTLNLIHTKIITKYTDHHVVAYTNAHKAIEQFGIWLNAEPSLLPDIIFLDINMPAMDGWEFLEEFQRRASAASHPCKVIMLTSSINSDDIEKAKLDFGVYDFISKPLTLDKLKALTS